MNKEEKKNIDSVLSMNRTLVDNIYNACKENSDIFEVDYVPVLYLKLMCDTAQESITKGIEAGMNAADLSKRERRNTKEALGVTNIMLKEIHSVCFANSKAYHVDYVPVVFLKNVCDTTYSKLEKGLKKGFGV